MSDARGIASVDADTFIAAAPLLFQSAGKNAGGRRRQMENKREDGGNHA